MIIQKSFYRFVFLAFTSAIIIFASIYILSIQSENIKNKLIVSENSNFKVLSTSMQEELETVIFDLIFLVNDEDIYNYLNYPTKTNLNEVIREFISYSKSLKKYDQIRFINTKGMETIRVNYDSSNTTIVDKANLQNKADRYYFKNTINLSKGHIYISQFDLNVEHGKIEKPYKPIIRFCMPVYNTKGEKKGIIVLNYLANHFINIISIIKHPTELASIMVLNDKGYFLKSENNKNDEFRFMFKDKQNITFKNYYPNVWKIISEKEEGHIFTGKGLFTYKTLSADDLKNKEVARCFNNTKVPKWKLVSFISQKKLDAQYSSFKSFVLGIDILLFAITFFGFFWYLRFDKQKKKNILLLIKSEKKFRTFYNSIRDAILIADTNRKIIDCNQAFTTLFGFTLNEIKGKQTKYIYENEEEFKKLGESLKSNYDKSNFLKVVNFRKKTGEIFHGETNIFYLKNDRGKVTGFVGLIRDVTDREKKEIALIESEEKFRTAFTTSSDSINISRLEDGVYVNINEGFTKILGFTESDVLGESSLEKNIWVNSADRERLVKELKKNGEINNLEAEFRKKNGEIITGLMSAKIINIGGELNILSITRDISDLKAIRIRLEQSEQWHREIFEGSHDAIFIVDTNSHFTDVNAAAIQLTGYEKDELLKMAIPDLHDEPDLDAYKKYFRRIVNGENIISKAKIQRKNGEKVDVEFRNKRIIIDDEIYIHTIAVDITEQLQAEKSIQESEEKFRTAFTTSPDSVAITNLSDGTFVNINDAFTKIFGYSSKEILGKSSLERNIWVHPEDREKFVGVLNSKRQFNNYEAEFRRKNGEIIIGLMSAKIISIGGILHSLSITRDITELKETQNKLKSNEQLLNSIMDSPTGLIIFSLDKDYRYTYFSQLHKKTIKRIWGADIQIGKNMIDVIINENDKNRAKLDFNRALKGEYFIIEEEYGDKEHRVFWENRYSPIFDEEKKVKGLSVFVLDTTERKKVEEELKNNLDDLERFNKLMVGRENKMVKLKGEVNDLRVKLNLPERYSTPKEI